MSKAKGIDTIEVTTIRTQEYVSIDDWEPEHRTKKIIPSEWRSREIGNNFNQQPGLDELKKIHAYLKKNVRDSEIMEAFGITAEILLAIRKGKYDPVEGISLDNQSKIYREFRKLEARIESLTCGLTYLSEIMYLNKDEKSGLKKAMKRPKQSNARKKPTYDDLEFEAHDFLDEEE